MSVATTILAQLGGNRFLVMTGAKNLAGGANSLQFSLPSTPNFVKNGVNKVVITLDPSDTYTVEFGKLRGVNYKVIEKVSDVYADNLCDVFTSTTGLDTSLGRR